MNLIAMESPIGLDRVATLEEVRCAMSLSSQGASERAGTCSVSEEIVSLVTMSDLLDSISN
jgi:hypothetical protein